MNTTTAPTRPPSTSTMSCDEKQRADDIAARIHALGHPVRLRALHKLSTLPEDTVTVTELTDIIDYSSQGSLSDHLKRLRDAGFLERRRVRNTHGGPYHYYHVNRANIESALRELWSYAVEAAPFAAS